MVRVFIGIVVIFNALLVILGVSFDIYTSILGVRDVFYDSLMGKFRHQNKAGTTIGLGMSYLSLISLFLIASIKNWNKGMKVGIPSLIFFLVTMIIVFVQVLRGLKFVIEFIFTRMII